MEDERQYYARRAAEELEAAARARSPEAEVLHRTLAEHYSGIVQGHEASDGEAMTSDSKFDV